MDGLLILSHVRPDGDTLGSGAALCSALRRAGKTAWCFDNPEITETYLPFMAGYIAPRGFSPAAVISVDVADEALIPAGAPGPVLLAVDHHPSNTGFAGDTCLMPEKASCGEAVMEIIKALCGDVSRREAELLYIAVSTDTGCFMYSNTGADTLRAAAELLELGADNKRLNTVLFRTLSPARMKLEGMIMSGLRFFRGGKISVATVTLDMMAAAGATSNDTEDLAGIAGKAAGMWVSVTLRETRPGETKVSMRSHPEVNVSLVCAQFGGGGHSMAAGCTIEKDPESALADVLAALDKKWPES